MTELGINPDILGPNRKTDLTHLSLGKKSKLLLEQNQALSDAISTFTVEASSPSSGNVALLLPGIVHTPRVVFEHQIPTFSELKYNVIGINYSDNAHSQELLKAQIADFIGNPVNSGKAITLVGVSLGAGAIIDLLANAGIGEFSNVRNAIMLGTIYSLADLKNGPLGNAFRLADRFARGPVAERAVRLGKRFLKVDRLYAGTDGSRSAEVKNELQSISDQALLERLTAISGNTKDAEELGTIKDVPVLFGWWEEDYASPEARQKLEGLFPNRRKFLIDGHHGWTSSGAAHINGAIEKFLSPQG